MSSITDSLNELVAVDGAMAAAVVDSGSGMLLGGAGSGIDLELAAAGNTEVVRAKLKTARSLGLADSIDDILITLSSQFHIIRPLAAQPEVFIYFVLDRAKANLALARMKVKSVESAIQF
ncbi:hypothetical protein [Curtobacterium sp. PhB115]|uniref:hypothetical protein n=1 Tax=Curtobacterium sp. PhB115 TaxID=2485173 RepID=UPI000F4C48BB|nr:hypothetical protein [Curtobacterium sp. PhB115]ROP72421.1 hypothetical protein EDF19_1436 [Curtobacterium sp. PhB115]